MSQIRWIATCAMPMETSWPTIRNAMFSTNAGTPSGLSSERIGQPLRAAVAACWAYSDSFYDSPLLDIVDAEEVGEGPNKVLRSGGGEHEGTSRIAMHGELSAGKVGDMRRDLGSGRSGSGDHRIDRPADSCTGSELRRPAHDRRLTDEFEDLEGEVGQGSVHRCAETGCGEVALKDLGRGDRNEGAVEIEERSSGGGHSPSA